ncbi:quinoprotein dehydrogenase-associated SoxYZ-like carrier [Celeribacter neptunius]|nr:quinoprotein dehydrogenase-associated SoxYZ-like carrier [Celeribacter neptunius]
MAKDVAPDRSNPLTDSPTWQSLRDDILGPVAVLPADGLFTMEAPYRAEDAAAVPIHIRQLDASQAIQSATVVIDENPAPVAAEFRFSPAMSPLDLTFRVRVDQYSNVRTIAGTAFGLRMDGRFVKASGGCSAPAGQDPEEALAGLGQTRLQQSESPSGLRREAEIQIRHPNYSGLQRDQITQLFIPAHFIDHLEVWQGDEMLFAMEGGISISANPSFRFSYTENGAPSLTVKGHDTDGNLFETEFPKASD